MEAWSSVTMRIDPGDKPDVVVDTREGELYNTSLSMVTERGEELTLWFESPRHLRQWMLAIYGELRPHVDDDQPVMRPPVVDDERPPAPVDRVRWGVG